MMCARYAAVTACAPIGVCVALAGAQFQGFAPRVDYPVGLGRSPTDTVLADFDNDGDLDLACSVFTSSTLDRFVVMLNNGDGTFGAHTSYQVGDSPIAIVAADWNRDGDPDLLTANRDTDDISLRLGNGDGTFGGEIFRTMGDRPHGIVVVDFNADSWPDVAVCNEGDDTVSIRFGNGSGGFGAEVTFTTNNPDGNFGNNPRGIAAADLNFNGLPDIITANAGSGTGTILYANEGSPGTFFSGEFALFVGTDETPLDVLAHDTDSDGDIDLVFSCGGASTVYRRFNEYNDVGGLPFSYFPSSSSFLLPGSRPVGICAADFDDSEMDGDDDLVVADELLNRIAVLMSNGADGISLNGYYDAGPSAQAPDSGDLDADGDIDIVSGQFNGGEIGVFLNRTTIIGGPPPVVRIDSPAPANTPGGCLCGPDAQITGVAYVPGGFLDGYLVEYRPVSAPGSWTTIWTSGTPVGEPGGLLAPWAVGAIPEGLYVIRVRATSAGGLSASDEGVVWVSQTYNTLNFVLAAGYVASGSASASVVGLTACVDGYANDDWCGPNSYTVDYRPVSGGAWFPVDPTNPVYSGDRLNDTLATWDTTAVPDATYSVRVIGENFCGDSRSASRTVRVDNTPPISIIDAPENCDFFNPAPTLRIKGTASDTNLAAWTLSYTGGPSNTWRTIRSGTTSLVEDLLADWPIDDLPPCAYTIRLRVVDQAALNCDINGHVVDYMVSINIGCRADLAEPYNILDLSDINTFIESFSAGCP